MHRPREQSDLFQTAQGDQVTAPEPRGSAALIF